MTAVLIRNFDLCKSSNYSVNSPNYFNFGSSIILVETFLNWTEDRIHPPAGEAGKTQENHQHNNVTHFSHEDRFLFLFFSLLDLASIKPVCR